MWFINSQELIGITITTSNGHRYHRGFIYEKFCPDIETRMKIVIN